MLTCPLVFFLSLNNGIGQPSPSFSFYAKPTVWKVNKADTLGKIKAGYLCLHTGTALLQLHASNVSPSPEVAHKRVCGKIESVGQGDLLDMEVGSFVALTVPHYFFFMDLSLS